MYAAAVLWSVWNQTTGVTVGNPAGRATATPVGRAVQRVGVGFVVMISGVAADRSVGPWVQLQHATVGAVNPVSGTVGRWVRPTAPDGGARRCR